MSATITSGSTTITPTLVTAYESERTSSSRGHELLGGGEAVTVGPASLRGGTLHLLFANEADAYAAELAHCDPGVFVLTYPERPTVEMTYVVAPEGRIRRALDDTTRNAWTLEVEFREVSQ